MTIGTCPACGAVTVVAHEGVTHADRREEHAAWHERLRRAITGNLGPLGPFDARRTEGI